MAAWDKQQRPGLVSRPSDGYRAAEPLLDDAERGRTMSERERRRHQLRSRSPATADLKLENKKKYMLAGFFLVLSLVSFVVQTETAVYIQKDLGWNKAYCMLFLTHGSWTLLWPTQLLILKLRKPHIPWRPFLKSHFHYLLTTCRMIMAHSPRLSHTQSRINPIPFMFRKIILITISLTIAGSTWYIAVNLTTPSDLTAIYNCSAFFAYVFSIFLLHEKPRRDKIFSVAVAIIGVLVVAYGDTSSNSDTEEAQNRLLGNIIIGIGSVMYGFYEVLYKKLACPPDGVSNARSVIFANTIGSCLGLVTLIILWIPLPVLHILGIESFALPRGEAAWLMLISVLANATFSGSFLVLISLTSPVLSSVAALLTIFLVAITDWWLTGKPLTPAATLGGMIICGAFFLLAWSTWREMCEEAEKRGKEGEGSGESEGEDD
ncbi:putative DUF6-like integral membrane protein [Ascodesmis nigricans]|uniref:Putative DUF6-like integral membrane protein n=1 Tax=Ascodesmis nigricans TaxID=341454 RepID=A0A4S2MXY8_9PEZI|nr:putative DUF6-like integral membrane protein [Ascodesmis nigricans]